MAPWEASAPQPRGTRSATPAAASGLGSPLDSGFQSQGLLGLRPQEAPPLAGGRGGAGGRCRRAPGEVRDWRRTRRQGGPAGSPAPLLASAGEPARDPAPRAALAQCACAATAAGPRTLPLILPASPPPAPSLPASPPLRPFRWASPAPLLPQPRPHSPRSWRPSRRDCASASRDVRPLRACGPPCPPFPPHRPPLPSK